MSIQIRRVLAALKPWQAGLPLSTYHARFLSERLGAELRLLSCVFDTEVAVGIANGERQALSAQAGLIQSEHAVLADLARSLEDWGVDAVHEVRWGQPVEDVVIDELCHSCLYAGATLARAKVVTFEHNDASSAAALIDRHRADHPRCLILTEGVFSMDGDRAPLRDLLDIAARTDAWLMVDDAHGVGVVENGRGSVIDNGRPLPIPLQMGTLSKAVGAYGGYLCTSRDVADLIRNRARSLIYTTALPPGVLAAALKGIEIIASDAELVAKPLENAQRFAALCALPPPQSAIVPIPLATPERALEASRRLEQRGYLAVAIRPPTVPEGTARLRCAFSATHTPEQIEGFAVAIRDVLAAL